MIDPMDGLTPEMAATIARATEDALACLTAFRMDALEDFTPRVDGGDLVAAICAIAAGNFDSLAIRMGHDPDELWPAYCARMLEAMT